MQKNHLTKTSILTKASSNWNIEGTSSTSIIYSIYEGPATNTILSSKRLNIFPPPRPKIRKRQGYLFSPLLFSTVLEVLAGGIRKEKETKRIRMERKNWNCLYPLHRKSVGSYKKAPRKSEVSNALLLKSDQQKKRSTAFLLNSEQYEIKILKDLKKLRINLAWTCETCKFVKDLYTDKLRIVKDNLNK